MSDLMTFPNTVEEFMDSYKVVDTEGIYMSKGAEMVPLFRMKQWFEHISAQPERKKGRWTGVQATFDIGIYVCDQCAKFSMMATRFCSNCGAEMEGDNDD